MNLRRRSTEVDGREVRYIDEGAGPPLLLLHGAPTTSFVYRHIVSGLRRHFRCIAPDFPGWGGSPLPEGVRPDLPYLAKFTERFVSTLGLQGVVLGVMDTAGAPGVRVVQRNPRVFCGLIVADAFLYPASEYPVVRRMLGFVTSRPFAMLNRRFNLLPWLVSRFGGRGRSLTIDEKAAYARAFPGPASRDRILQTLGDLRENETFMRAVRDELPRLTLPVLLIYGEHDPMRRIGVQDRLMDELPRATRFIVPGEAHFPHEGDPATFVDAVSEWARATGIAGVSGGTST